MASCGYRRRQHTATGGRAKARSPHGAVPRQHRSRSRGSRPYGEGLPKGIHVGDVQGKPQEIEHHPRVLGSSVTACTRCVVTRSAGVIRHRNLTEPCPDDPDNRGLMHCVRRQDDISGLVYVGPKLLASASPTDTTQTNLMDRYSGQSPGEARKDALQALGYKVEVRIVRM